MTAIAIDRHTCRHVAASGIALYIAEQCGRQTPRLHKRQGILHERHSRQAPINHSAVARIIALNLRDPEAADREIKLRTPRQILERYGFPDELNPSNGLGDTYWVYRQRNADGTDSTGHVTFYFAGSYVIHYETRSDR